jgi:hypothetical protein
MLVELGHQCGASRRLRQSLPCLNLRKTKRLKDILRVDPMLARNLHPFRAKPL